MDTDFASHLAGIQRKIAEVCTACGRSQSDISIVAVTKTFPPEIVESALTAGLTHIGENRIQEAERKAGVVRGRGIFHLIGNLQSNKVKKAVSLFDWIQTIDDLAIARQISQQAAAQEKELHVLIEVNSSGEPQKHGAEPSAVMKLAEQVMSLPRLSLRGLMTVGPLTDDQSAIQRAFNQTYILFDKMKLECGSQVDTLSMGMSDDYELAIREGSTMVRLGSVLFGNRQSRVR